MSSLCKFTQTAQFLEIDEEGYPILSGLRCDDPDFLDPLFQNLERLDPLDPNSKLVSHYQNQNIYPLAFDKILVAQKVKEVDSEKATWIFLGNIEFSVKHSDWVIDEWNRISALVGPHQIPATLLRSAQTDLLFQIPSLDSISPRTDPRNWQNYWKEIHKSLVQEKWEGEFVLCESLVSESLVKELEAQEAPWEMYKYCEQWQIREGIKDLFHIQKWELVRPTTDAEKYLKLRVQLQKI